MPNHLLLFFLMGCSTYWVHPSKQPSDFASDSYRCKQESSYLNNSGTYRARAEGLDYEEDANYETSLEYDYGMYKSCLAASGWSKTRNKSSNQPSQASSSSTSEFVSEMASEYDYSQYNCTENSAELCYDAALAAFEKGHEERALIYLVQGCDFRQGDSCGLLAQGYIYGGFVETNLTMALHYGNEGCSLQNGNACYATCLVYSGEFGGVVNKPLALSFAEKACSYGNGGGCEVSSKAYQHGYHGAEVDSVKAMQFANKACALGVTDFCR
jgi:TPR repeat protein